MVKTRLKQGTLDWEKARALRIGGSEVFDIVRYYASDRELLNCGINAEKFKSEKPYTTAWALYHKMIGDGIYQKPELEPEFAEYGHAAEPYGLYILKKGRKGKLKAGEVYISDKLIASLDISGISEDVDRRPFNYGSGIVKSEKRFVCEQKTMQPKMIKNGLPFKYIIQAQYQILMTRADFYILQLMVLKNDTVFERGKITEMSLYRRIKYLDENMTVTNLYFQNNERLSSLIKVCLDRFFEAVEKQNEPTAFIEYDAQKNIIESIRLNTAFGKDFVLEFDLSPYLKAKAAADQAESKRKEELQRITEAAKEHNICRFKSGDGTTGSFSAAGAFLIKEPKI